MSFLLHSRSKREPMANLTRLSSGDVFGLWIRLERTSLHSNGLELDKTDRRQPWSSGLMGTLSALRPLHSYVVRGEVSKAVHLYIVGVWSKSWMRRGLLVLPSRRAMGRCSASGCANSSKNGLLVFRFPRDPAVRKMWAAKARPDGWMANENSRLCEVSTKAC